MKVVYEPGEIERIEEIHRELIESRSGGMFPRDEPDRIYGLTFKVTKPGLAEYLLVSLLNNKSEDFELGIDIQSINFDILQMDKGALQYELHRAIDEVMDGERRTR